MPELVRRIAARLAMVRGIVAVAAGPAAAWRGISAAAAGRGLSSPAEAVGIPMKALRGQELYVRPGTSDLINAVAYYRHGSQSPAPQVVDPDWIVELGSNCGVVLTALGVAYPRAQMLGVEADPENAAAARRNTERFGDRCHIVEVAVWEESTELVLVPSDEHGSHGTTVRPSRESDPGDWPRIQSRTIDDLLAENLPSDAKVGYLHVTIEGSEPLVFAAGGDWPHRVDSLRVEAHPYFGYAVSDCIGQLEGLGYEAWEAPDPPAKWVFAIRR